MVKDIRGYIGYKISDIGEVTSPDGRILKSYPSKKKGYVYVVVAHKRKCLHRLVAETFIPNPKNLPQVNHIDGNKLNNSSANLEWCTAKQNTHHAISRGLRRDNTGPNNNTSKLSDEDYNLIKALKKYGFTYKEIAERFSMSRGHIVKIVNGRSWKHKLSR